MKRIKVLALITALILLAAGLCGCGKEEGLAGTWVLDPASIEKVNTAGMEGDPLKAAQGSIRKAFADVSQTIQLNKDGTCVLTSTAYERSVTVSGTWELSGDVLTLQRRVKDGTLNMADLSGDECVMLPDENGTFILTDSRSRITGNYQMTNTDGKDPTAPVRLKPGKSGAGGTFTQGGESGTFTLQDGNLTLCYGSTAVPRILHLDGDEKAGRDFAMTLDGAFTLTSSADEAQRQGTWRAVQDGWEFTFAPQAGPDLTVTLTAEGTYTAARRGGGSLSGAYTLKNGTLKLETAGNIEGEGLLSGSLSETENGVMKAAPAPFPAIEMDAEGTFTSAEGRGTWTRDGLAYTFTYDSVPLTVLVREDGTYIDSAGAAGIWDLEDHTVTVMMLDVTVSSTHICAQEGNTLTLSGDGNTYIQVYKRK